MIQMSESGSSSDEDDDDKKKAGKKSDLNDDDDDEDKKNIWRGTGPFPEENGSKIISFHFSLKFCFSDSCLNLKKSVLKTFGPQLKKDPDKSLI